MQNSKLAPATLLFRDNFSKSCLKCIAFSKQLYTMQLFLYVNGLIIILNHFLQ